MTLHTLGNPPAIFSLTAIDISLPPRALPGQGKPEQDPVMPSE